MGSNTNFTITVSPAFRNEEVSEIIVHNYQTKRRTIYRRKGLTLIQLYDDIQQLYQKNRSDLNLRGVVYIDCSGPGYTLLEMIQLDAEILCFGYEHHEQ